jgi:hypothetical protein
MAYYKTYLTGALLAAAVAITGCSSMTAATNNATLTGQLSAANEVPPVPSTGTGSIEAVLNKDTNVLTWKVTYSGLTGPVTAAHFHGPAAANANAGVVVPFTGDLMSPIEGKATLTPAQAADLLAGKWYVNLHTAAHKPGEIRAQMIVR